MGIAPYYSSFQVLKRSRSFCRVIQHKPGFKQSARLFLAMLIIMGGSLLKYSVTALQKAAWPVLRQFPRDWLLLCLPFAHLRPSKERALRYLLSD